MAIVQIKMDTGSSIELIDNPHPNEMMVRIIDAIGRDIRTDQAIRIATGDNIDVRKVMDMMVDWLNNNLPVVKFPKNSLLIFATPNPIIQDFAIMDIEDHHYEAIRTMDAIDADAYLAENLIPASDQVGQYLKDNFEIIGHFIKDVIPSIIDSLENQTKH